MQKKPKKYYLMKYSPVLCRIIQMIYLAQKKFKIILNTVENWTIFFIQIPYKDLNKRKDSLTNIKLSRFPCPLLTLN